MTATPRDLRFAAADAEPAFVARIRLRARRHVAWLRRMWEADAATGSGVAITHGEVDRILAGAPLAFHDASARELGTAIADADREASTDVRLQLLRRELALSDAELDLLALAVAVEADPWLRRAFGYMHDDATATAPTPWLAHRLFGWPGSTQIGADSGLIRWRLARPHDGHPNPWSIATPWVVDPHAASWLLHGTAVDARLAGAAELVIAPPPEHCVYPGVLAAMRRFAGSLASPIELAITGAPGAGRRTLARQLCAQLARPLLVADAAQLLGDPATAADAAIRVVRSARFAGASVYWHDAHAARPEAWRAAGTSPTLFGTTPDRALPAGDERAVRRTFGLPALTRAARIELWTSLSSRDVAPAVRDWPLLPADIARAAAVAPAGDEAVAEACRPTLRLDGGLATRLPRPYTWDDLVLAPQLRAHLEELAAQATLRWSVYEDWGFGALCPMGRGIAALFAGPSGTGKTMAAQVIARELGLELYRVDLAGVTSKYIGETEKNLRAVFDACEHANVLLFFDEADALFGQRTPVSDAHDRFANIEIDYLLQRMEQLDGLAILATNRFGDIDPAFVRRVRFIVDFTPPAVAERRTLWRLALRERSPADEVLLENVDWDALAERLDMTGAEIKAAAIGAAFLARSAGTRITMHHVLHAAHRELAKRGVVIR